MDCNANEILAEVTTTWVTYKGTISDFFLYWLYFSEQYLLKKYNEVIRFFVMLFADYISASF